MRDVAKRASVSTSTVSHVINSTRFVTPDLAERVRGTMAELGYQPNAVARSLRRKETLTLGMLVPDNANPFFAQMARAIEDICYEQGYSLIFSNSEGDAARELANADVLLSKRVDGLIFVAVGMGSQDLLPILESAAVVVVDRDLPGIDVDAVLVDNLSGGYQATEHLLNLGHRRIACITGPSETTPSADRVTGLREALRAAGLPVDESLIVRGDFQFASGFQGAQALLTRPDPPTAIFACNDLMAVGCIAAAAELGYRVPAELSIVGFDDTTLASYTTPPLTTVTQPISEVGRLATQLLIRRIQTPNSARERHVLPTGLVVRGSTAQASPRSRSRPVAQSSPQVRLQPAVNL